ncbi:Hypothetical protein PENO1_029080 [Penicillium occitanis (nom. inval.)]|nr:Hypothetical protein PENO1_029080 [Penicillium occitanis (nom. inval.)]PCH10126.1 hypothetical protein PENOC_003900 [Penicillium occitanis (nom. inval.)]
MALAMRPPSSIHSLTGTRSLLSKDKDKDSSSSSGRNDSAYLKRREQVRRAQRTHRERKDQYFKTLESEVLRLRANEANFLKKIQELETHIFHLREAVKRTGIDLSSIEEYSQSVPGSEANLPALASVKANNVAHDASASHSIFHNTDPLNDISE